MATKNTLLTSLALTLLLIGIAPQTASAQLLEDPSTLPVPELNQPDHGRAVVLSVVFTSTTSVELQEVLVSNVRAKGSAGDPPLIKLELLDQDNNLLSEQSAWHPLWEYYFNEDGSESSRVITSGTGTFYVPLSGELAKVRISDIRLNQELITVDVSDEVATYCTSNSESPICSGFNPDIPTPEPSPTTVTPPTGTPTTEPTGNPTLTPTPILDTKKVAVCHLRNRRTLYLPEPAVRAHLRHGDLIGECRELLKTKRGRVIRRLLKRFKDDIKKPGRLKSVKSAQKTR